MYAYQTDAPSLIFDLKKREMLQIEPVATADAYMKDIEINVTATNKMLDDFVKELKTSITLEKKLKFQRLEKLRNPPKGSSKDKSYAMRMMAEENKRLQAKLESERAQTENYTHVMSQINNSHNLISTAVTNMSTTIGKLFEKNSETFRRLVKIGKDTADIYQRIITTLDLIEDVFLERFERHAQQNMANLDSMMEAVAAYYQLHTMIVSKYAWNAQDVRDTMALGKLDIEAYYSKQMSEHMATKDSFLDFATHFAIQRSGNFQRFIDTKRPWKTTDSIGITILGFIGGTLFGYHKNKKWR